MNKTQLTTTEIESLRIAIAEECGWKKLIHKNSQNLCGSHACKENIHIEWLPPTKGYSSSQHEWEPPHIPPYTTSLDAIQAAAMERFKEDDARQFQEELDALFRGVATRHEWQLTALDWCIAFARTAKIWRYKQP